MDLYRDVILDHYKHPRNFGTLPGVHTSAESYNATCGDRISMDIVVGKNHEIEDVRFSGNGCAISMAAASMLTEKVKGMRVGKVLKLRGKLMTDLLGTTLTPSRTKCATLSLEVLHKAILSVK